MFKVEQIVKDNFWDKHICKEFFEVDAAEVVRFMSETWPDARTAMDVEREAMVGYAASTRMALYGPNGMNAYQGERE